MFEKECFATWMNFVYQNATDVLNHDVFQTLMQVRLYELLEFDTFYGPEVRILSDLLSLFEKY